MSENGREGAGGGEGPRITIRIDRCKKERKKKSKVPGPGIDLI